MQFEPDNEQLLKYMAASDDPQISGAAAFVYELKKARAKFPAMASAHEGYAVVTEEIDELWDIVKQKQTERDYVAFRKEAIQCGAMVLAFLTEIIETGNRR